jgi:hypothetical protein
MIHKCYEEKQRNHLVLLEETIAKLNLLVSQPLDEVVSVMCRSQE